LSSFFGEFEEGTSQEAGLVPAPRALTLPG